MLGFSGNALWIHLPAWKVFIPCIYSVVESSHPSPAQCPIVLGSYTINRNEILFQIVPSLMKHVHWWSFGAWRFSLSCFHFGTPSGRPALDFHDCSWPSRRSSSKWADERQNLAEPAGRGGERYGKEQAPPHVDQDSPNFGGYYSIPVSNLPSVSELYGADRLRRYHWFWLPPYCCPLLNSNSCSFFTGSPFSSLPVSSPCACSKPSLLNCLHVYLKWKGYTNRTLQVPG